jgi:hypothetical protein
MGFTYANTPVSFDNNYQRVKTEKEALANKSGNCIDGTILFASFISALGYDAIIALPPGHAFVIAALPTSNNKTLEKARLSLAVDSIPNHISPLAILQKIAPAYILIETTVLQRRSNSNFSLTWTVFEEAIEIAKKN